MFVDKSRATKSGEWKKWWRSGEGFLASLLSKESGAKKAYLKTERLR